MTDMIRRGDPPHQPPTLSAETIARELRAIYRAIFEGDRIDFFEAFGQKWAVAFQIGAALKYARGGQRLVKKITGEWAEHFREGVHFIIVRGVELAAVKERLGELGPESGPSSIGARTAALMLLSAEGIHLVLSFARTAEADRLRPIVAKVMPALISGQGIPAGGSAVASLEDWRAARERRLAAATMVAKQRTDIAAQQHRESILRELAEKSVAMGREPARAHAWLVNQLGALHGIEVRELLPPASAKRHTPTDIGRRFGLHPSVVGTIILALDEFQPPGVEIEGLRYGYKSQSEGGERDLTLWEYTDAAVEQHIAPAIEHYLESRRIAAEAKAARKTERERKREEKARKKRERQPRLLPLKGGESNNEGGAA